MEEHQMFPGLLIAIGAVVLAFGKRIPVLGAAVGALLGAVLLRLFPGTADSWWLPLAVVGGLAIAGFFLTGAVTAVVNIAVLVLGALGGGAIVLAFLDLFGINNGALDWLFAAIGAGIGLLLVRRFKEWALIVLAGLVGALLVTRGLTIWFPTLQGALGTLLVIALAGGGVAFQGGLLGGRKAAAPEPAATPVQAPPTNAPATQAAPPAQATAPVQPPPPPQTAPPVQTAPLEQPAPPPQPAAEGSPQLATDNQPTPTSTTST
jgi:hypothetical protein